MSSRMNTRASNAEKHPGDIHKALNRRTSSEVALHKKQKKAEKDKKNAELIRQKERVANLENELDRKYAKKLAHAPTAPPRPAPASKRRSKATTADNADSTEDAEDANDHDSDNAAAKTSSGPRAKVKTKSAPARANTDKGDTGTEVPANAPARLKPKPKQMKKQPPLADEAAGVDVSDGDEMAVGDDDDPAPRTVARKRVHKTNPAKKAGTKGKLIAISILVTTHLCLVPLQNEAKNGDKGDNVFEPEDAMKAVKQSLEDRATFRTGVDKMREVQVPVENSARAAPGTAGKGKSASTARSIGFKTDIKKWSAAVTPRGPPASTSNASHSRSALTSARSSTLVGQSTTSKRKEKAPEPEPEPVPEAFDEDEDHGLTDDNAEDLARERASFRAEANVVLLSSPPPSPPVLPHRHLPRERLSSVEELTTPPGRHFSTPESVSSPIEQPEAPSLKRRRSDSTKNGANKEEPEGTVRLDHDQVAEQDEDIVLDSEPESVPIPKNKSRTTDMGDVNIQPAKRLKPASSKAIAVKTEKGDKQDENVEKATDASKDDNISKRKKKYNKKTLPSHANTNRRWARVFIPTFFAWLARQKDVWGPSNNKVLNALRNIWRVVYNEELPPEQDAIDGAVFNLVSIAVVLI
ncbi:hypothetical protein CONPUDRAFT_77466 [Coniophora puteana RWD-64-598 SS2]|uniref:Uncharacterized protein n=1 Tax=Coniophora puteana (strain RWD-64-598) TaxID=741705 RepID=A0A5M3M7K9_CONPW|nr:uncharacterized protein CONPUDRAFT_77466 [Coniophora puteana RWD-64-598 SS2]EIW75219.1 hypothetical protein CONPUDRAFT_77466 [Coniophora puteana RWD-64-598 SS2]